MPERCAVIGSFRDEGTARSVADQIARAGVPSSGIHVGTIRDVNVGRSYRESVSGSDERGGFIDWLGSLFGSEDQDGERYHHALKSGNTVVAVDVDNSITDQDRDRIVDIMERNNALDLDEDAGWREAGGTTEARAIPQARPQERAETLRGEARTIPVIHEDMQVGKRVVQRGGVRVFTKTVERPVEEKVQLHEEHAHIERHPVNRALTDRDREAMHDQTIEITETAEEPVIQKQARVVEEVVVAKDSDEHTEVIHENVHDQEVEVERIGPSTSRRQWSSSDDSDFRQNFQRQFGSSGGSYESYQPAYRYGYEMGSQGDGKKFEDVESSMKTDFLRKNPNSSWDRMKGAVRYGWEKSAGQR